MTSSKEWFGASRKGLRATQAGKPKIYILRELIQNAWDEPITFCKVRMKYNSEKRMAEIRVEDDSPKGFGDLRDAFVLFRDTEKRKDPTKRGRYTVGEKQAISMCEEAKIVTTKGTVIFDKSGRRVTRTKSERGSVITLHIKMTKTDYDSMSHGITKYLPPKGIKMEFSKDGCEIRTDYREPFKVFETSLQTEMMKGDVMTKTTRKTKVHLHKDAQYSLGEIHMRGSGVPSSADEDRPARLYEMGIPVCDIECDYSIDVQQRIPMSIDRETVSQAFLKHLYADVLNATYEELDQDSASDSWVRTATSDTDRISEEAVKKVVEERYGDKVCVETPGDSRAKDEALLSGYRVVHGNENSKEEWDSFRKAGAIQSSGKMFGTSFTSDGEQVVSTSDMSAAAQYYKDLAKRLLDIEISVEFWNAPVGNVADYGSRTFRVFMNKIGRNFFKKGMTREVDSLFIHEVAHEKGHHTDRSYIDCVCELGAGMKRIALQEPEFYGRRTW